jgi:C4-dicarboxylate-specific signal transduction histidine kinase
MVLIVCEDITETKNLRQQAERMERLAALGQLSATIAHEIRNRWARSA